MSEIDEKSGIEGKVIVITGASSGIGEATARYLAARGARVALGARRKERIDKIVNDIRESGGKAEAFACDVTRRSDVEALVQGAIKAFGRVDVIVNNAGLMPLSPLEQLKVNEWEQMVDVNLKGVLYGIAAALPLFKKQNSGHFINISSVAGHLVFPAGAVYCATKFAVRALSEGLRMESGPYIRTTEISPGAIATELTGTITDSETAKTIEELVKVALPAETIARAIAYAVSEPAAVDVNEIIVRPTAQTL
jgi:NADP-dependent 3-hydroxy acid dehydrogenase YdfG